MGFSESLEKMIALATGSKDPIVINAVLEVQKDLINIQEENRKLRLENEELRNRNINKQNLEFKDNAYYPKDGSDNIYCPRCLDKNGELINMLKGISSFSAHYDVTCPECKTNVYTSIKHGVNTDLNF